MVSAKAQSLLSVQAARLSAAAGLAVVVALLAYVCIEVPRDLKQVTPIWLANAVVLTVLLRTDRARWPLLIAFAMTGNIVASLYSGGRPAIVLGLSAANVVEYLFCALALNRALGRDIDVSRSRDLLWIAAICGVCAPLLSGTLAAAVIYFVRDTEPLSTLTNWGLSNALGLMLLTPCLLVLGQARSLLAERPFTRGGWLSLILLVGTSVLVFSDTRYPLLFVIPPALAFVALELEVLGAVVGTLILAVLAMTLTALGMGPINQLAGGMAERAHFLQVFLVVSIFAALPLATINAQRRRLRDVAQEQTRLAEMAEELAGVGYWRFNLASRALTWSDQMYDIAGVTRGTPVPGIAGLDMVHPDDRAAVFARFRAVERTADPGPYPPTRLVRPSGEVRYVAGNMVVERDTEGRPTTVFGVMMDITAQKQAEIAISESEARFRMLAENGSDLVTHTAMDGRLTYVSPSIELRLGYRPDELIGQSFLPLILPEDTKALRRTVRAQINGRGAVTPVQVEYRALHRDGHITWFEARPTVAFDPDSGQPTGVTDIIRDISQRKVLEAQLRQARNDAEEAAAVKADFLANMSHELRTPLTAVLGFAKLVEEQPELGVQTRGYVERVSNAGKALMATVNDILDFSKLEAGQVDIKLATMSPADLTRETVELFEAQARDKDLSLAVLGLEAAPPLVKADPDRLRQILLNLIGNAVKFTEAGGVEVALAYDGEAGWITFSVSDTGPGMPADRVGQLFQRFSQIDGSTTRKHGGTGLGLAICKGLAEAMGGEIGVESQEGQGSRFWFSTPARMVQHHEQHVTAAGGDLSLPPGRRILIVDDNANNRALVRAILTPFEVHMTDAADGDEAISLARETVFDLILMDLRMPRVDGRSATGRIRQEGVNIATPILAFSADASTLEVGDLFDGQIAKPLSAMGLVEALAKALIAGRAGAHQV